MFTNTIRRTLVRFSSKLRFSSSVIITVFFGFIIISCETPVNPSEDKTPDDFTLTKLENQNIATLVSSEEITITGIAPKTPVNISGNSSAKLSINNGDKTVSGMISDGDNLKLYLMTPETYAFTTTISLTVGTLKREWIVVTKDKITINFIAQSSAPSILVISNKVSVSGIDSPSDVSISGDSTAKYKVNDGKFTNNSGKINNGDSITLQVNSSADSGGVKRIIVKIGVISAFWIVTTTNTTNSRDSFQKIGIITKAKIDEILSANNLGNLTNNTKYNVNVYKMIYETSYKSVKISESALVAIPAIENISALKILSIQHGTIIKNGAEPTAVPALINSPNSNNAYQNEGFVSIAFASLGYVTISPDYIGFGASASLVHPYLIKEPSINSVYQGVKALTSEASKNNITLSDKLVLMGYSEGGYVTVASQEYIEKNPIAGLSLIKTYAGAGPYSLVDIKQNILGKPSYTQPFYLAYALTAYKGFYDDFPTDIISKIYASAYSSVVSDSSLFDGTKNGTAINSKLITTTADLYTNSFIRNTTTDFNFITSKLEENSVKTWAISTPLILYHSSADEVVPYSSSQKFKESFSSTSGSNVSLKNIELLGGFGSPNHLMGYKLYLANIIIDLAK